jgi:transcriptional regulator with XRE-family HTH domain
LSQKEVAHKMGVTQASYAAWERDPVAFRPDQLALLASTLQVSIDQLVTGSEPPKKRGHGPVGKARRVFEELSQLPRHQQQDIITFVEAMLRARRARNQANSTTD